MFRHRRGDRLRLVIRLHSLRTVLAGVSATISGLILRRWRWWGRSPLWRVRGVLGGKSCSARGPSVSVGVGVLVFRVMLGGTLFVLLLFGLAVVTLVLFSLLVVLIAMHVVFRHIRGGPKVLLIFGNGALLLMRDNRFRICRCRWLLPPVGSTLSKSLRVAGWLWSLCSLGFWLWRGQAGWLLLPKERMCKMHRILIREGRWLVPLVTTMRVHLVVATFSLYVFSGGPPVPLLVLAPQPGGGQERAESQKLRIPLKSGARDALELAGEIFVD